MPPLSCVVRSELASRVTNAVQEVYNAKAEQQQKFTQNIDHIESSLRLARARNAERDAVSAFDKHREEHGC